MGNEKICPLMIVAKGIAKAAAASAGARVIGSSACPGRACAWWDAAAERCAIRSFAAGKRW